MLHWEISIKQPGDRCIPALQEETLVDEDRFERLEKLIIKRNKSMCL